ncbi:hypothetical protein [Actinomadura sp. 7K534]|uniref:hypothetical protein n=1 Tax=Actinomadura sp. 7K534 TaxID=2530366 RepID=UPI00104F6BAB|nr:hypothetical protein [Actinomadura sp. 7K534]TDB91641.1 hypothetical protein E1266_26425 [Actinomadura sp. 7K534]
MTPCSVTTGFFVLGRCGQAAVVSCPGCGRPVCGAHAAANGLCPECGAAQGYGTHDPHHPAWTGGYRRHYYQRSSQLYNDALWYTTFNEYDRGAFNPGDDWSHGGDWGPDDDTGFVDS